MRYWRGFCLVLQVAFLVMAATDSFNNDWAAGCLDLLWAILLELWMRRPG